LALISGIRKGDYVGVFRVGKRLVLSKEGQTTIPGLVLLFSLFITLGALTPAVIDMTGTSAGNLSAGGHAMASTVVRLVPLFMWL